MIKRSVFAVVALLSLLPAAVLAYQAQPKQAAAKRQTIDPVVFELPRPLSVEGPAVPKLIQLDPVVIVASAPKKAQLAYVCDDWRKTKILPGTVRACEWR